MKRLPTYLVLILGLCIAGGSVHKAKAEDGFESARQYAIDLINYIRLDPAAYAVSLGLDPAALAPGETSPQVVVTSQAMEAAYLENTLASDPEIMDEPGDEAEPEEDGITQPSRIASFSGVVSFVSFVDPLRAVQVVVNNQFIKELDPAYAGDKIITNSLFFRIGVAFWNDVRAKDGAWYNAYYLTVTLTSPLTKAQRQVINLANQARYYPAKVGIGPVYSPQDQAEIRPVFFDSSLQNRLELFLQGSASENQPPPAVIGNAEAAFFKTDTVNASVQGLFENLLTEEAWTIHNTRNLLGEVVLNPKVRIMAVGISKIEREKLNRMDIDVGGEGLPAALAAETESLVREGRVYGLAYTDADKNGIYSPGEGMRGAAVTVYYHDVETDIWSLAAATTTDTAGHFDLKLPLMKPYQVYVTNEQGIEKEYDLAMGQGDAFFPVLQQPEEAAAQ